MKKHHILFIILSAFIFSSCEKVVELKVDSGEPILIIDSQLSTEKEPWVVTLSLTQPYFDQSTIDYIGSATVTIADNNGRTDTLNHTTDGVYVSDDSLACESGMTYTLSVVYLNNTYTATEQCFYQEPIDFIRSYFLPEANGFIPKGYYVFQKSLEYEPEGDFYMWKIYQNDTNLLDQIGYQIENDENREGGYWNIAIDPDDPLKDIDRGVFPRPFPYNFEKGDSVRVEQYRISREYYNFIGEFSNQQNRSGTPFDPPPSNPKTNIIGGAYGFFSVVNVSSAEVVVSD